MTKQLRNDNNGSINWILASAKAKPDDNAPAATISHLIDLYLRDHSRPKRTEASDTRTLRAVRAAVGDLAYPSLTKAVVRAYTGARLKGKWGSKPVKEATVRREITALQAVLNWALKNDYITGAVWRLPKPAENYVPRDRWLTEDQEKDFLNGLSWATNTFSGDVYLFAKLALTYGVRQSAIMDLKYGRVSHDSIDFNVPGRPVVRKRRPVVPMTKDVLDLFRLRQGFTNSFFQMEYVLARNTPYQFKKAVKEIGYEWVTPHVLKHTAITLMLRAKADPGDVAALTATDLRTIYKTYRHHSQEELRNVAERRMK